MAGPTPFKTALVDFAKQEHELLKSTKRGDPLLRERIKCYCNELAVVMSAPVDKFHYLAVFISWCMRRAGASKDEFPTAVGHWEYARRALEQADKPDALFRGRSMDTYSPVVGDLIHLNRHGGKVDYNTARSGPDPYRAESEIVVDVRDGQVLVVMGNQDPAGNVGTETFQTDFGLLVQRSKNPIICIIEVVK